MARLVWISLALALAACGSSKAPPPPTPTGPPAAWLPTPASDDVQVATVNGKPVWGSCVTAQAAHAKTKQEALAQCVDFELLAQAADARGIATDPEVALATRTALVSQLVAKEYEDKYQKPADFGPAWDTMLQRNRIKFDHVEYRGSAYARINVDKKATPEEDARAHAIVEEIATKLTGERGLSPPQFFDIAQQVAAGRATVSTAVVTPYSRGGLDKPYEDALFSIPEIGETSPHAVRTKWGWDVVLFNDIVPEQHDPADKIESEMLPELKRQYFGTWANQIAQKLGVKIEIEQANLPALENL
jgi:hypothetical protein